MSKKKNKVVCLACEERLSLRQFQSHLTSCEKVLNIKGPWITIPCRRCNIPIHIHVDWESPLILCKPCKKEWISDRKRRIRDIHAKEYEAKQLRGRSPKSGWHVQGGLPTLGRRR